MPNINDAFPSKYVKASDLKGRSVVVTIDRVDYELVGQEKKKKPVLYFVGKDKGMVLNKTNANTIMHLTDSPVTEEWKGAAIALYPSETSYQGEMVDCIRIKAAPSNARKAAPAPPPPEPEPEEFDSGNGDDEDPIPF